MAGRLARSMGACLVAAGVGLAMDAARADAVGDVHDLALVTARAAGAPPPAQNDTLTIVDVAMFQAANGVERRFRPYRAPPPRPPAGADSALAAVGAGCAVLAGLHPARQADVATGCEAIVARLPAEPDPASSLGYGRDVGQAVADARRAETKPFTNGYRPIAEPGRYVATPLPLGADTAVAPPYALRSASQLRPTAPPPLSGETWALAYNEVKALGGRVSKERTPEQAATALFWASAGPQQYLDSIGAFPLGGQTSPAAHARLLALMTMAMSDAGIAVFDAKYAYDAWRPITAIRNGDKDGNDATERDASWQPLLETPLHQEYPCAHCATAAALVGVVAAVLGTGDLAEPLVFRPSTAAGTAPPRSWPRALDVLPEIADARVWGGMHFRFSTAAGLAMGLATARWVVDTQLQPDAAAR